MPTANRVGARSGAAPVEIRPADAADPVVAALIELHLAEMHASTPSEFAFALDASGLAESEVSLSGAWLGGDLAGLGALKALSPTQGEIKSMRTAPAHVRKGVAQSILDHLIATARARGYERVSLETGTSRLFGAAVALYERNGFVPTGPFGDYAASVHNRFLTLALVPGDG